MIEVGSNMTFPETLGFDFGHVVSVTMLDPPVCCALQVKLSTKRKSQWPGKAS